MRSLGEVELWTPDPADEPALEPERPRERPLGAVASWTGAERERGSGTLLAIGLGAILVAGGLLAVALATVIAATHRADAAADLAALSAARLLGDGEEVACGQARAVAAANETELVSCRATPALVDVVVRARTGRFLDTRLTVAGRARAGPPTITQERESATRRADRARDRPFASAADGRVSATQKLERDKRRWAANRIALDKRQPPPGGKHSRGLPLATTPRHALERSHRRANRIALDKRQPPPGGRAGAALGHDPRAGRTGTSGGGVAAEMPVPPWRSFETPIGNGFSSVTHHMPRRHLRLRRVTETVRRAAVWVRRPVTECWHRRRDGPRIGSPR